MENTKGTNRAANSVQPTNYAEQCKQARTHTLERMLRCSSRVKLYAVFCVGTLQVVPHPLSFLQNVNKVVQIELAATGISAIPM